MRFKNAKQRRAVMASLNNSKPSKKSYKSSNSSRYSNDRSFTPQKYKGVTITTGKSGQEYYARWVIGNKAYGATSKNDIDEAVSGAKKGIDRIQQSKTSREQFEKETQKGKPSKEQKPFIVRDINTGRDLAKFKTQKEADEFIKKRNKE